MKVMQHPSTPQRPTRCYYIPEELVGRLSFVLEVLIGHVDAARSGFPSPPFSFPELADLSTEALRDLRHITNPTAWQ